MTSSITNRQLFFLLLLTLTAYSIINIPKVLAQNIGAGGWVPLLLTALLFALFAAVIVRLNSAFPGKMLFDYSQAIVGKRMAYVLACYFVVYFFMISAYLATQLTAVLQAGFYPKTPRWVTLCASVIVFGFVAHRGITNVARFFEMIGTVFVMTAVFTHLVMLLQGDFGEIQPLFRASKLPQYLLGVGDCLFAFLGIELLLIFPLSGKGARRTMRTAVLSLLFVGLFYVFVVSTCIMMLGMKSTQNYRFALIEAIKQVDNPLLERFDILFLTMGFAGLVAGICGVYLALVEYASRLFRKVKRVYVVMGVGAIMIALGLISQAAGPDAAIFESTLPAVGLISAFLIPTSLLLIAKVKGLVQKIS